MYEVDKVSVVVFVKKEDDIGKYFRLFRLMMGEQVTKTMLSKDHARIETDKFLVRFHVGGLHMRGTRAHYVINMMQDAEWDSICALPITSPFHYLKEDPKWSKLFEDEPHPHKAILRRVNNAKGVCWRFKSSESEYEWLSEDLESSLKSIQEEGWIQVSGNEELGFYAFTKTKERQDESI